MAAEPPDAAWLKLGAEPGLCAACQHAKLLRYPRLPVAQCVGFDPLSGSLGAQQQGGGGARGDASGDDGDQVG